MTASLFLMGMENGEQGIGEPALVEQQKQLSAKIDTLTQEQDYLLFQKTMYASDSKYLVINITARTGQLKYKNRVLRDFHFTLQSGKSRHAGARRHCTDQKDRGPERAKRTPLRK